MYEFERLSSALYISVEDWVSLKPRNYTRKGILDTRKSKDYPNKPKLAA